MPTIADCLKYSAELALVSDSARVDIEILLAHVLKKDRTWLYTWPEKNVETDQHFQLLKLISRRAMGEPIAYLVGKKGFWSLELEVNKTTLIPRPETELLVELALKKLPNTSANVLDLGTGTGAIALALAKEKPQAHVLGVDRLTDAVELAQRNAKRNDIKNAEFIQSNWFEKIAAKKFDLIVSNPPYIDPNDPHLSQGDVRFEPVSALVSENQGFSDLKYIIFQARKFLSPGCFLLVEHGYRQGEKVRELFASYGYVAIETSRDLADRDRVTQGQIAPT